MDKQEYREIVSDIRRSYDQKEFDKVLMYAEELDMRKVSDSRVLEMIADAHGAMGDLLTAKEMLLKAYEKTPMGRKLAYKLSELSIQLGDLDDAVDFYEDFCKMAPHDNDRYLLKYRLGKAGNVSKKDLAKVLASYCSKEVDEKWMAELASLYDEIGETDKCNEVCDDIILWFADGIYVQKALELKSKNGVLTSAQKSKLDQMKAEALAEVSAPAPKAPEPEPETERELRPESKATNELRPEDLDSILEEYITIEDAFAPPEPVRQEDMAEAINDLDDAIDYVDITETEVIPIKEIRAAAEAGGNSETEIKEAKAEAAYAAAVESALIGRSDEMKEEVRESEIINPDSILEELELKTAPVHEEVQEKIAESMGEPSSPEEIPDVLSGSLQKEAGAAPFAFEIAPEEPKAEEIPEEPAAEVVPEEPEIIYPAIPPYPEAPAEETAAYEAPAEEAAAYEAPVEEAAAYEAPAEEAVSYEAPAEESPVMEAPAEPAPAEEEKPLFAATNGKPFSNIEAMQSARTAPPKDDTSFWKMPEELTFEENPGEEEFPEPVYGSHRWFEQPQKPDPDFEEPVFGSHRFVPQPEEEVEPELEEVYIEQVEPEPIVVEPAEEEAGMPERTSTIRTTSSGAELLGLYAATKSADTPDKLSEKAAYVKKPELGGKKTLPPEMFADPTSEPEYYEGPAFIPVTREKPKKEETFEPVEEAEEVFMPAESLELAEAEENRIFNGAMIIEAEQFGETGMEEHTKAVQEFEQSWHEPGPDHFAEYFPKEEGEEEETIQPPFAFVKKPKVRVPDLDELALTDEEEHAFFNDAMIIEAEQFGDSGMEEHAQIAREFEQSWHEPAPDHLAEYIPQEYNVSEEAAEMPEAFVPDDEIEEPQDTMALTDEEEEAFFQSVMDIEAEQFGETGMEEHTKAVEEFERSWQAPEEDPFADYFFDDEGITEEKAEPAEEVIPEEPAFEAAEEILPEEAPAEEAAPEEPAYEAAEELVPGEPAFGPAEETIPEEAPAEEEEAQVLLDTQALAATLDEFNPDETEPEENVNLDSTGFLNDFVREFAEVEAEKASPEELDGFEKAMREFDLTKEAQERGLPDEETRFIPTAEVKERLALEEAIENAEPIPYEDVIDITEAGSELVNELFAKEESEVVFLKDATEDAAEETVEEPLDEEEADMQPAPFMFSVDPHSFVEEVVPDIVKERQAKAEEEARKAAEEEAARKAAAEAEAARLVAEEEAQRKAGEQASDEPAAEPSVFIPLKDLAKEGAEEEGTASEFDRAVTEFELSNREVDESEWAKDLPIAEPQVDEAPIIEITTPLPKVDEVSGAPAQELSDFEKAMLAFDKGKAASEDFTQGEFESAMGEVMEEATEPWSEPEFGMPDFAGSEFARPEFLGNDFNTSGPYDTDALMAAAEEKEVEELSGFEKALREFEKEQEEAKIEPLATEPEYEAGGADVESPVPIMEVEASRFVPEPAPEPIGETAAEPVPEYQIPDDLKDELSEFLLIDGMEERICHTISSIIQRKRNGDPTGGHLIVTGDAKSGKTYLTISVIKAVGKEIGSSTGRVAKVKAESLNGKDMGKVFGKISGSDLIIENAGYLNDETIHKLIDTMNESTSGTMVVLEGNQLGIENIMTKNPELGDFFHTRLDLDELSLSQWAQLACDYAEENGYVVGDMALLALHAKIDEMNLPTTRLIFSDIQGIIDQAIEKADKRTSARYRSKVRKAGEYLDLNESDFM